MVKHNSHYKTVEIFTTKREMERIREKERDERIREKERDERKKERDEKMLRENSLLAKLGYDCRYLMRRPLILDVRYLFIYWDNCTYEEQCAGLELLGLQYQIIINRYQNKTEYHKNNQNVHDSAFNNSVKISIRNLLSTE